MGAASPGPRRSPVVRFIHGHGDDGDVEQMGTHRRVVVQDGDTVVRRYLKHRRQENAYVLRQGKREKSKEIVTICKVMIF